MHFGHHRFITAPAFFIGLISGLMAVTTAQASTIEGTVVDAQSQKPLGKVQVMANQNRLITDASGRFRLTDIDSGAIRLSFSRLGYQTQTESVESDGKTDREMVFTLKPVLVDVPGITITAQREGQAKALNQQMQADNIQNVIAADLIGRFPDQNTAEALQRLPGVTVDRDQGEGRYVLVRGTEPRLTAVKINGQEVPSPEGDIRFVALDVIAADQLAAIELNKALLPEMDADAIGGSINLVTPMALSNQPTIRASLAGGYNAEMQSAKQGQGLLGYSQRFLKDDALGFQLSGSYGITHRGSDNNEMSWGEEDVQGVDRFTLQNLELRDYEVTRDRLSLTSTLDYRLGAVSQWHVQALYSRFADQEYRRLLSYNLDDGDYQSETVSQDATLERELKDRYEAQDIVSIQGGGKHALSSWKIDYNLSWSFAQEREPDALYSVFEQEGVEIDLQNARLPSDFPKVRLNAGDANDPNAFTFSEFVFEDNKTTDQNFQMALNIEKAIALADMALAIKAGGKARFKLKDRENKTQTFEWDSDTDAPTLNAMRGGLIDDDFLGGKYRIGPSPDPDRSRDFFNNNRDQLANDAEDDLAESAPANYEARENIYAGYGQVRGEWGSFMALFGARFEHADLQYEGHRVEITDDGVTVSETEAEKNQSHVLPQLHLRYRLAPKSQIRAAFTYSLARPNYYDLVPYEILEDDEISRGNPDLKTTVSANVDLMAEHYFANIGIVSAGFFYKFMEDPIYTAVFEEGDLSIEQPRNLGYGEIYGFELAWVQALTFLPGFLNGFGTFANYTFAWSETHLPARNEKSVLPGQSDHSGNIALTYEKYGFSGRLSGNYTGQWLRAAGESKGEDEWADTRFGLDLSLSQEVYPGLRVFAEGLNLTNAPLRTYQGRDNQPIQQEYYLPTFLLGVKYQY